MKTSSLRTILTLMCVSVTLATAPAQLIRFGPGPDTLSIQLAVNQFRMDLGALNPNVTGRREINWDGVPDALSAPNNLPPEFFNVNSPRGVILNTPGTGFQVSANSGIAPVEFGNIDPSHPSLFAPFSVQRLFTALGSNIVDVNFFVPGTTTPGLTRGFGSVFSDVDLANTSSLEFFDSSNTSLGVFFVPSASGDETFSFLGVSFLDALVSRVRIVSGNQILATGNNANDLVVMDDFIFGEPIARNVTPVPDSAGGLLLLSLGIGSLGMLRRRWPQPQKA